MTLRVAAAAALVGRVKILGTRRDARPRAAVRQDAEPASLAFSGWPYGNASDRWVKSVANGKSHRPRPGCAGRLEIRVGDQLKSICALELVRPVFERVGAGNGRQSSPGPSLKRCVDHARAARLAEMLLPSTWIIQNVMPPVQSWTRGFVYLPFYKDSMR